MWLGITVLAVVLVCVFLRKTHEKQNKWLIFGAGILLLILELIKQFLWMWNPVSGWGYYWSGFPWHLCSIPMFLFFIIPFLKDGKIKRAMCSFVGTFGLLGGVIVMLYPATVLNTSLIIITIQTMVHHATLVIVGVYVTVSGRVKLDRKNLKETLLSAFIIFAIAVSVALVLNTLFYFFRDYLGGNGSFNLFYISPFQYTVIPILDIIHEFSPTLAIFVYVIVASLVSFGLLFAIRFGLNVHSNMMKKRKTTIEMDETIKIECENAAAETVATTDE